MSAQENSIILKDYIFDNAPFSQCHASTVVETPDGLLAAWFGGTREGDEDVEIWSSRMIGDTWSVPVSIANGIVSVKKRFPCWNPVLFLLPDSTLILFYKVGPNPESWWGVMKRSRDFGKSWGEAIKLPENILGPIKNKPILVPPDKLICGSSSENNGWKIHFETTSDWGHSWKTTAPHHMGKFPRVIQPSILIHPGSKLQAICRSREGHLMTTWSYDSGQTWTAFERSGLPNPNSGIDAVTLSDGVHVIVYNHVAIQDKSWGGPRTPLNVALSLDGIHWSAVAVLENEPGEYSYPAIIQSRNGFIHITYTWNRTRIKHVVMNPEAFIPKPIHDGKWPD
jgi:predicted neuraminidase